MVTFVRKVTMLKRATALSWWDVTDELFSHIKAEADRHFAQEERDKEEAFSDLAKLKERQTRMWRLFLEMIGGLPEERTPLQVQEVGAVRREGYVIRKLIFQSLPGCYVTANLYLPLGISGKRPAVLFCCGHAEEAKAYPPYQRVMIDLVSQGFVVLGFDPVGQGERKSYFDPKTGQELIGWGTTEHDYDGNRCYLTGTNIARYFVWDGIRALDYLISRPEVDPERIGVTGTSGGGTQTCYLMVADERIRAAVPCTFITSRQIYLKTGNPHDAEQNLLGAIQHGFNYDDFLLCFAPRPVLIGAVTYDFFPIEGTLQTFERARRAYKLYGAEDKVELVVVTGEHEYAKKLREACVRWFCLHLMGKKMEFQEPEFEVESLETLWCLPHGQVRIDLPNPNEGEAKISSYIRSGKWKYVVCHSYAEAHDFQWYAISQLKPLLNKRIKPWDTSRSERYQELLTQMLKSQPLGCNELYGRPTGPGVYLLLHQHAPSEFYRWLEEV